MVHRQSESVFLFLVPFGRYERGPDPSPKSFSKILGQEGMTLVIQVHTHLRDFQG